MKYGFIGCGNMGGSIAKALAKSTNSSTLQLPLRFTTRAQQETQSDF